MKVISMLLVVVFSRFVSFHSYETMWTSYGLLTFRRLSCIDSVFLSNGLFFSVRAKKRPANCAHIQSPLICLDVSNQWCVRACIDIGGIQRKWCVLSFDFLLLLLCHFRYCHCCTVEVAELHVRLGKNRFSLNFALFNIFLSQSLPLIRFQNKTVRRAVQCRAEK